MSEDQERRTVYTDPSTIDVDEVIANITHDFNMRGDTWTDRLSWPNVTVLALAEEIQRLREDRTAYLVYEQPDKTEGRSASVLVAVCGTEEEAMEVNKGIHGVQGIPPQYGGTIYKTTLGPSSRGGREKIFGPVQREGRWVTGWVDGRDPDPRVDPDYAEYQRLKAKFEEE